VQAIAGRLKISSKNRNLKDVKFTFPRSWLRINNKNIELKIKYPRNSRGNLNKNTKDIERLKSIGFRDFELI